MGRKVKSMTRAQGPEPRQARDSGAGTGTTGAGGNGQDHETRR